MLAEIESYLLRLVDHSKSDQCIGDLEQRDASRERKRHGRNNRDRLHQQLTGISIEEAVGSDGVDQHAREQAGRERAPYSADCMHTDYVERVVVAEPRL